MIRVAIRSGTNNQRLFDAVIGDIKSNALIEVKHPRMKPVTITFIEFANQVNKAIGRKVIIIDTTEL